LCIYSLANLQKNINMQVYLIMDKNGSSPSDYREAIFMSKKAITIVASEETYQNLSSFTSIDDLNKTVRHYKERFADQLSKSAISILNHLHNYSAKYLGCSFKSKGNIAESLNISRRTVIRVCQILEELGIIKQYQMKRSSDMQQTSNAIVIQPIVTQDSKQIEQKCHTKTTPIPKTNTNTIRTIRKSEPKIRLSDFIPSWVNKDFSKLAISYFNSDVVEELWRIATIHGGIHELRPERTLEVSIEALKTAVYKYKKGSIKTTFNSYFNGIMKKLCKKYSIIDLFDDVMELKKATGY
jgi:DNA-binding Lrp family transcriptional regulator